MHTYDRQQLVKMAHATGLVKEAAPVPTAGLSTAAKALGTDIKSGVGQFLENVSGRRLATAEKALKGAEEAAAAGPRQLALPIEGELGAASKGIAESAELTAARKGLEEAQAATTKARLGAGIAGAAGLAGLGGLALYRRAAANAAKKKLLMGAGAAGLGGLALGAAMD